MTLSRRPTCSYSNPRLVSSSPTASAPASLKISHVQLRDLIVCPAERGVLWYVSERSIIEQDILSNTPGNQHTLANLTFTPVTLSTLRLASSCPSGQDIILLAAGGQEAELFLAMYSYTPRRTRRDNVLRGRMSPDFLSQEGRCTDGGGTYEETGSGDVESEEEETSVCSTSWWQHTSQLVGSINNNVLLYMPPETSYRAVEELGTRPVYPRLVVSNNDCTVKFFDVSLARRGLRRSTSYRPHIIDARYRRGTIEGEGWGEKGQERVLRYERVGCLRLPVPVNHTSISPDGSTVLSCGDSSTVYLHRILPVRDGISLLFEPLATYNIPSPAPFPTVSPSSIVTRSNPSLPDTLNHRRYHDPRTYLPFAFVNGQWVLAGPHPFYNDVSAVEIPPACFTTAWSADGMRFAVASQEGAVRVWDVRSKEPLPGATWETGPRSNSEDGSGSNVDSQRALFEFTGGAPPWGVRSLKFIKNASGKELLVFTEHVSRIHVIDADTFSIHDVIRIPHVQPDGAGTSSHNDFQSSFPPSSETFPLLRWATLGGTENLPETIRISVRRSSVTDRLANTQDRNIGISGSRPGSTLGATESEVNEDVEAMIRRAREDLRAQTRFLAPRRRPGGILPPELRASNIESREHSNSGADRVLSPNVPFTRSPGPAPSRTIPDEATSDSDSLDEDTDTVFERAVRSRRFEGGHLALDRHGSLNDYGRARARERERREMDGAGDELPRRNPGLISRMADHTRMEEDIAYHAAVESMRRERDRMRATRDRTIVLLERRQARLIREREERERLQEERRRENEGTRAVYNTSTEEHSTRANNEPVVIPPLSSVRSEEDVRNILALHGISSVRARAGETDAEGEVESMPLEQAVPAPPRRRPSFSSVSTISTTTAPISTRAQAGSISGEDASTSGRADSGTLLIPPARDSEQASSTLERALNEYGMDVDGEGGTEHEVPDAAEDSDATEIDCMDPNMMPQRDGVLEGSLTGQPIISTDPSAEVTVSSSTSPTLSVSTDDTSLRSASSIVSDSPSTSQANQPSSSSIPFPSSSTTATSSTTSSSVDPTSASHTLPPCRDLIESTDRLDVAGITFDPCGAYIYVATVDGITEWSVKGADERWWSSSGFI